MRDDVDNRHHLVGLLANTQATCDFSGTASVNNAVVTDLCARETLINNQMVRKWIGRTGDKKEKNTATIWSNKVANDADGIVQASLRLLDDLKEDIKEGKCVHSDDKSEGNNGTNHLVTTSDEHGDSLGILALLND